MAYMITIANRKGGVGKTTLAIALAETFVSEHQKNVAVVDLDPQSSASEILLSEEEYAERVHNGLLLANLWWGDTEHRPVQPNSILVRDRHQILARDAYDLAILPNSPQLWDLELDMVRTRQEPDYRERLREIFDGLREVFDVIIVDCPPGKLIAAEEAILASDLILCPIVPERLSVWGMDKLIEYFNELKADHFRVPPWRFIISRYSRRRESHVQLDRIRQKYAKHFLTESGGLLSFGNKEFIGLDQSEAVIQRTAKFHDERVGKKSLEQLYGHTATPQLRKMAARLLKLRD